MAVKKFKNRPGTYMLIPLVAAVVGWFTNWLAVQMLFYPIQYRGLPLLRWPEQPLGLIGWQVCSKLCSVQNFQCFLICFTFLTSIVGNCSM